MTTSNIISTPNITGNVGSCETTSTTAKIGSTPLNETYKVVFTSSCSGEVVSTNQYVTHEGLSEAGVILLFIFVLVGFFYVLLRM